MPLSRKELERCDRERVWHPFTQMAEYEPLIFVRGQGCTLYDIDGRAYLDGVSSMWCNLHGHRHPRIDAAIRAQLDQVAHVTSLGASNPATIELAERLVKLAPAGLERVYFSDDGSTAVEVALKMAFQYWRQRPDPRPEKTCFLAFADAYHGDTLGSVSVGGVPRFHAMFEPLLFETLRAPLPDSFRLPPGVTPETACGHYLEAVERILARDGRRIAGIVVEPLVQGAAGMVMHPPGFLSGLRELTRRHETLLICDEVAVGFGRTGTMFACEQEQVSPDFLCLAKGLTGGYLPLAATLATDEVWRAFLGTYASSRQFFHGHTYAGNPLGCAAALASLEVFAEERTLDHLPAKIERLGAALARLRKLPHVGDARQRGLIGAVELVRERASRQAFPWEERYGFRVCEEALRRGVWLRPLGSVLVLMPPLAVSLAEIDRLGDVLYESIVAVTGGG